MRLHLFILHFSWRTFIRIVRQKEHIFDNNSYPVNFAFLAFTRYSGTKLKEERRQRRRVGFNLSHWSALKEKDSSHLLFCANN